MSHNDRKMSNHELLMHLYSLRSSYPHEYKIIEINDFREFMSSREIFGNDDVVIDDELIHVIHGDLESDSPNITSFTTSHDPYDLSDLPDCRVMSDDFLDEFSDDSWVLVESGKLVAKSDDVTNDYVKTYLGQRNTLEPCLDSINWIYRFSAKDLALQGGDG